ncbi:hypothetical protein CRE_18949 [Caenorhabditis remanei]|uniref:Glycosyltransferase 2-like domain-containing protein n=1 Tax=Caenorhabditis remanei TaxID=31234 RepID=E3LKD5_CAERE|nr:hypothetical protein CRE_18949 [Caenorhabditis remanei]
MSAQIDNSTGEVVLFLDAHCEVNTNWLPPLLAPIKQNRKVMTVPVIDGIDSNSWEYRSVYGSPNAHHSGIFEWGLLYKETQITERESAHRKHNSQPFRSPTHAGGLFAINRLWFKELGYYDEGLQIWGGEQYELSFKIWQCGGGIVFVPCSHVGHVYRSHMPYGFGKFSGKPVISIVSLFCALIWKCLNKAPDTVNITHYLYNVSMCWQSSLRLLLPAGLAACISPIAAARDPRAYPDPDTFNPDNFDIDAISGRDPYAYIPFSAGPRNCIGQKFAILEEKTVLSRFFRKYEVESLQTEENLRPIPELILRPYNGIRIKIKRREAADYVVL